MGGDAPPRAYTPYISTYRMSRTTYRLFDGTTRVSTAVELKDGSILMVHPRKETFADVNLWKWLIEHESDYVNSSLTLLSYDTNSTIRAVVSNPHAPEPLSPYTPPLAPINIDNLKLGPTVGESGVECDDMHTFTPHISPRPEFQEPLPSPPPVSCLRTSASAAPYDPCALHATADGPGYDLDDKDHREWLMKCQLEELQSDLACLSQTMNKQINLMDVRIKALIKKLD